MIASSLRLRLILAFSALVSLILLVGLASYAINRSVSQRVANLRSSDIFDLESLDLAHVGLEVEGRWNPSGSFVAADIEVVPASSRPRLRGPIQALDASRGTFQLYGTPIHLPDDVEVPGREDGAVRLADLSVGQRVEVTCEVENGQWKAEKIEIGDLKHSDKIKGTVTSADLDGQPPETLEIHGLTIVVEPSTRGGPESALGRVKHASQMLLALQECRRSALQLAGAPNPEERAGERAGSLADAVAQFAEIVEHAYSEGDDPLSSPARPYVRILDSLTKRQKILERHVVNLEDLARNSPLGATRYLSEEFDPFLQESLMPYVHAYLGQAEEDLGDQLRGVVARTAATTRIALAASVLAVALAALLGFLVWRSIHRPIRALHGAALRIGQGHLDTRVALDSSDEFGDLARSFNRMASEIASTTVSMASLERVFDSMAAALFQCDLRGRITNVNRAATLLLGRSREELIGEPFELVCRLAPGERVGSLAASAVAGNGRSSERAFLHRDGTEIPVSLSDAELSSPGGELQGHVCVAQDLTGLKAIEQRLRESLEEKELLLREVHHRVKNNMQVVSSLLAMHAADCDPLVQRQLDESQSRIRSIALIHEQLYRSDELAHIDIRSYLQDLAVHVAGTFGNPENVRIDLDVADVRLDLDQSLACGLLVNELLTNALKHAFRPGSRGTIEVALRADLDGRCLLTVSDDGRGMDERASKNARTLGMSLLHTLAEQLGGRVDLNGQDGTRIQVSFPCASIDPVAA